MLRMGVKIPEVASMAGNQVVHRAMTEAEALEMYGPNMKVCAGVWARMPGTVLRTRLSERVVRQEMSVNSSDNLPGVALLIDEVRKLDHEFLGRHRGPDQDYYGIRHATIALNRVSAAAYLADWRATQRRQQALVAEALGAKAFRRYLQLSWNSEGFPGALLDPDLQKEIGFPPVTAIELAQQCAVQVKWNSVVREVIVGRGGDPEKAYTAMTPAISDECEELYRMRKRDFVRDRLTEKQRAALDAALGRGAKIPFAKENRYWDDQAGRNFNQ